MAKTPTAAQVAALTTENDTLRARVKVLEDAVALNTKASATATAAANKELKARLDELATQLKTLTSRATAADKAAAELEKKLAAERARNEALAADDQATARRLEELTRTRNAAVDAAGELREKLGAAHEALAEVRAAEALLRAGQAAAEAKNVLLAAENDTLRATLGAKELPTVVPPQALAGMTASLLDSLGSALPGLVVKSGELKMKVAVGDRGGFVVPTAAAPASFKDILHEVTLQFARAGTPEPG